MNITLKKIQDLLNQEMKLLDDLPSKLFLISFCAVFATIFILIYNPINIIGFEVKTKVGAWLSIKSAGVIGAMSLVISQLLLKALLRPSGTVKAFLTWVIIDLSIVSIVLFIFYRDPSIPFWRELYITSKHAVTVSIIPYSIGCILISLYKSKKAARSIPDIPGDSRSYVSIKDLNGASQLAIHAEDLIFFKADDNYVQVIFISDASVQQKLIRTTLKALEEDLDSGIFIRVHRSYMVAKDNILSIDRHKGRLQIRMKHMSQDPLPVSTTYNSKVSELIPT